MDELRFIVRNQDAVFIYSMRGDEHVVGVAWTTERFEHRTHFGISTIDVSVEWKKL